jgi:hypothetical protein
MTVPIAVAIVIQFVFAILIATIAIWVIRGRQRVK